MKNYLETNAQINESLISLEPLFEKIMESCGPIKIELTDNCFESLVSSIVGQQLSNRVVEVIWGRVSALTGGDISPGKIMSIPDEDFRKTGMSYQKITYVRNLSEAVLSKELCIENFKNEEDEAIIKSLVKIKGIGQWTAEMFLIFSLGRPDVFSTGDGGLQRAVKGLYRFDEVPAKQKLLEISSQWKPLRTYASLYLWRALNQKLI